MTLHVEVFDEFSGLWDEFVASHPGACNYHRFGWKKVVEQSFGHEAIYLGALDDAGKLRGVLPLILMNSRLFGRFLVSLPFFNYGGLLCADERVEGFLLNEAERILEETGSEYVELRHVADRGHRLKGKSHKVTMILELQDDSDRQWTTFNAKLRNQIRKAEKSGLTIACGGIELLDGFYEVFCRNMRDLGTPVYGKNFFRNILEAFPGSTRVMSVLLDRKVIASGIAVWYKETVEVPWASSVKDYKTLCPNNLLYWHAIRFSIENGFRTFDFGRSTPHEGTYKFKEQWGARPVQLHWHYLMRDNAPLPELNPKNRKYQMAINVWQRLPVALTKLIGPVIVKNIP